MGSATLALVMGIVSVPLCCAPLGILGGVFGFRAMSIAKQNNVETPARAIVALVLAGLSLLSTAGMIVAYVVDSRDRAARTAAADEITKGKLEGAALEPKVACALTEKALLAGVYQNNTIVREVSCKGAYSGDAKASSLAGVSAMISSKPHTLKTCFVKGGRWFVATIVDDGSACPTDLPPVPSAKDDKAEDDFRKALGELEEKRAGDRFVASLDKIKDAVKAAPHADKKCPAFDPTLAPAGNGKIELLDVDLEYLTDPAKREDAAYRWKWLTDHHVRTALDSKAKAYDRSGAVRDIKKASGPYLLVWASDDRRWPIVIKKKTFSADLGYLGGEFDGWGFIVDTRSSSVVCSFGISARNSKSVTVGRRNDSESGLMSELESDLKSNLRTQVNVALDKVGEGKLSNGTSLY